MPPHSRLWETIVNLSGLACLLLSMWQARHTHSATRLFCTLFILGGSQASGQRGFYTSEKVGLVQQGARGAEVQLLGLSPRPARPLRNCLSFLSVEGSPVVLPYLTAQLS